MTRRPPLRQLPRWWDRTGGRSDDARRPAPTALGRAGRYAGIRFLAVGSRGPFARPHCAVRPKSLSGRVMVVIMLVVMLIGVLTTLGMTRMQSRLEPWDDSRLLEADDPPRGASR